MGEQIFPMIKGQRGMATGAQLRAAGWTADAIRHMVAHRGRRLAWRVYMNARPPLSDDDWIVAAWLWAGPSAVLTGARALARLGVLVSRPGGVRFLVRPDCRNRVGPRGAETIRTRRLPVGLIRQDVRVAPLERALVDACALRDLPDRELRALTLAFLQAGRTTPDRLEDEAEAARPHGLQPIRAGIHAFRTGAWSLPEELLAEAVRGHEGLPLMLSNPRLVTRSGTLIGYPDGYFVDSGVAVQVHSVTYHTGVDPAGNDRWTSTVEHDTDYQAHGIVVVPVTPDTLERRAASFVTALAEVVRLHGGRELPDVLVA